MKSLNNSKNKGLSDKQILELIHKSYPSAILKTSIPISNINQLFDEISLNTYVPVLLTTPTGRHMILIGKDKDGILYLKEQQVNNLSTNNSSSEGDLSLFKGKEAVNQYLHSSQSQEFSYFINDDYKDVIKLTEELRI